MEQKAPRRKRAMPEGSTGAGGAVYGLGFIGALAYYVQTATSFWMGALGVLKAVFWPAFLVYSALRSMGA